MVMNDPFFAFLKSVFLNAWDIVHHDKPHPRSTDLNTDTEAQRSVPYQAHQVSPEHIRVWEQLS